MNILLFMEPKANRLRLNHGTPLTAYNLLDMVFHVPQLKVPAGTSVFVIVRQANGVRDIVEAKRTGSAQGTYAYYTYQIPASTMMRIQSGPAEVALLLIDNNDISSSTEYLKIQVDMKEYYFTHQTALLRNVNSSVTDYYEKIVELLMKLSEKGENNHDSQND